MRRLGVLALALSLGLAGAAVGQPTNSSVELVKTDTPLTTASGATFTAPSGWRVTSTASMKVLEPPEADSHLALVDVRAENATAAIAAAWASYRPDANRPLRLAMPQTPLNGWEERHLYSYETSPNERVVVYALAWRAGEDWTVAIVEASHATFEKRNGALSLTIGSLRPKGYQREMFSGSKARPLDAERIALLKDFVQDVMQKLGIPGVGLALIDGGKVVFEGGLGVKALGKPDPVDADTLFLAASNTKAMTTLLLAKLVDENKLRWDQPVTEVYPGFKLGDAETTRQVLVKHLVCACTGLPVRTSSGCSIMQRRRPRRRSRRWPPCSRPAGSARSTNTAMSWPEPQAMSAHMLCARMRSSAPPMTRPCGRRCSARSE